MEVAGQGTGEQAGFGTLLRRFRVAAGLSQEALAERARLSVRAVSAYERGERQAPYRDTVALLVQALGLSPEEATMLEATVPRRRGPGSTAQAPASTPGAPADVLESPPLLGNLPPALSSFIGRARERAEVRILLDGHRLVTLTGAGGAGKTRLSLAVAEEAGDGYVDGVWLAELAPLADPALAPRAVAQALGVREEPSRSLLDTLGGYFKRRRALLVLDNCEHLLDACAEMAEALLRAAPGLRILASSREALGVPGEQTYRVPSLATPNLERLPDLTTLGALDAVRLFMVRAREQRPDFTMAEGNAVAVASICARLDGIPLAIELAAARLRGLAVEQLAARLDRRFALLTGGSRTALPRQRTLRATVDWSYELLSGMDQRLFNRLAVFAGGFTLEAAEEVCAGDGLTREEVLDALMRLVDKSLVAAEEREDGKLRYRLLETLRQYGQDRLAASYEAAALPRRHALYYLALAEQAERELHGPSQAAWMDSLELEHANLRIALAWGLDDERQQLCTTGEMRIDLGLRLSSALHWFWVLRGHRWEGRRWLDRALLEGRTARTAARAKALVAAGEVAVVTGDRMDVVLALLAEGVALYTAVGEKRGLAYALGWLGFYTRGQELGAETVIRGDYERGTVLLTESLALAREAGDPWQLAWSLLFLALSTDVYRDEQRSLGRAAAEESLTLMYQVGDTFGVALVQRSLGWPALYEGDFARAGKAFSAERAAAHAIGDKAAEAFALTGLGDVARARGVLAEAQNFYAQCLALYRELDFDQEWLARILGRLGAVALEQGDWTLAEARANESLAIARSRGESAEAQLAPALEVVCGLAAARGQAEHALRLAGATAAQRERTSLPLWPREQRSLARRLAPARQSLTEQAQTAAWQEGQAMTLEQAVAYALDEPTVD